MCHYAVVRVTDDGGTGGSRLFKTKRGGGFHCGAMERMGNGIYQRKTEDAGAAS